MSRLEHIVAHLGGELQAGGRRALIPGPGHSAGDRSVSLLETPDGRILIHCFSPHDDWREVRLFLVAEGLLPVSGGSGSAHPEHLEPRSQTQAQTGDAGRIARARRIWSEGRPLRNTVAAAYLVHRQCTPPGEDALRFHPAATSRDDRQRRPALIAAIRGTDDALQGVEISLLAPDGRGLARLATPRRIVGRMKDGAVRLCQAGATLAVAEGVATALSAGQVLGLPAWAALSAANLAQFTPPPGVTRLVIAHDNDAAGRRAADQLARRIGRLDRPVETVTAPPPAAFNDWNDAVRARPAR